MMYDTLHQKLLRLPDETEVYPAHGAGSMCGRNMSSETSSTIGDQKKFNYALQPMSKDEFIRMMTSDLPAAPDYFAKDAEINRSGAPSLASLAEPTALSAREVSELLSKEHVVLDVRSADEFGAGHVPGSLNIGLGGQFAIWAGSLISMTVPIIIVANSQEKVDEAAMRLARVGIENVKGYLSGGMNDWREAGLRVETVPQLTVDKLNSLIEKQAQLQIIDVRRSPEYESGHVPRALHAPLANLYATANHLPLDPTKPTAVICAGGYRSSAATSILKQHNFTDLMNIAGGTSAWIKAGYPVEVPTAE
jgi:hydroxyacylglutathione hydrolase